MNTNNSEYIKNSMQGEKIYKFFEKSPRRSTLKTPPPKRKKSEQLVVKPLLRRSTRLKSEVFVDEYDISKVDLNSSNLEYEPLKKRATLSPLNSSNEKNKAPDKTDPLLGSTKNKESKRMKSDQSMPKLPLRRSTRLKSEIFVDSFHKHLLYSEKNMTRIDLNSSQLEYEPLKITTTSTLNSHNTKIKVLDKTDTTKNKDTKRVGEQVIAQKMTDSPTKESKNTKSKTRAIQNERCDQVLDNSLHNHAAHVNGDKIAENAIQNIRKVTKNKTSSLQTKKTSKDDEENAIPNKNSLNSNSKEPSIKTIDANNLLSNIANDEDNLEKPVKASLQPKTPSRKRKSSNSNKTNKLKNTQSQDRQLDKMAIKSKSLEKDILFSESTSNKQNQQVNETSNRLEKTNTSKRKATAAQTYDDSSLNNESNKSQTSKQSKQAQVNKKRAGKVNVAKQPPKKYYTKLSKLTKEQIKDVGKKKIPKDRLNDVLDMMDNDCHHIWDDRNISCNLYIHLHCKPKLTLVSDQNMKLKYARQFLLQRDWVSLSKILCLSNSSAKMYYPLLSKYAALLLAHTDKDQFNTFTQFLASIDDSSIMKKCTKI